MSDHSPFHSPLKYPDYSHADPHSRHSLGDDLHRRFNEKEYKFDTFKLDTDVAKKLADLRSNKKVAFLSSCHRTYYPEHPGHSKFALEFQAHLPDPTLPAPEYYRSPFSDLVDKPISKKGYGIGGLSAPRFARLHGENVPAPNQYQKQVKELLTRQHRFPPQVWMDYGLLGPDDKLWDEKVSRKLFSLWGQCHQNSVAFGTSVREPRFGKNPKWNLVGPGNYVLRQLKVKPPRVFNSFQRGPAVLNPSAKLHCSYGPKENCLECGIQLMGERDYYRSRFRVNPVPLRPIIEDTEENILQAMDEKKKPKVIEKTSNKAKRVLFCRNCYCKALRGESRYWKTRAEVLWLFEKTRHCGYFHEHNGIPEFTLKASCYWTRRLARKEAVLSQHYPDACEKRIVEKKQKYQA